MGRSPGDTPPPISDVCRVDRAIATVAAARRGLATTAELRAAGLSRWAIAGRVKEGRLHPMYRGVYLVGHPVAPPLAQELAAVLACAPYSFLSHFSAAYLWQLLRRRLEGVDVMVVGRNPGQHEGIRVHRTRQIDARDVTRFQGDIPITTPARTLLDLAETDAPWRHLEVAWDEAHTRGLVKRGEMQKLLERSPGRRGAKAIAALLDRDHGPTLTRSQKEEILLALVRAADLPQPEMNVLLGRYRVDFLWRDAKLVVEVDGPHHLRPRQRDADNRRDADLAAAGWHVIRVSDHELLNHREAVIARLARALG
jgi:very-short-patch-repair endonuclease